MTLNSNHFLIIVQQVSSFQMNLSEPPYRTFTNLKKTDQDSYIREAEESFALIELPSSCSTDEPQFRKILNSSAKHHIPQGHILNMIPNVNKITKPLIIERDALRSSSSSDPHIHELNAKIRHNIADCNRQKWTQSELIMLTQT